MASNKDKALLTILYLNKELRELDLEIAEHVEYLGYLRATQNKKPSTYMAISKAENALKSLKSELEDIKEERQFEFTHANFTADDFGHARCNYTDAKQFSAMSDIPECVRVWYQGEYTGRKYAGLDDYNFRYANDEQCKYYAKQYFAKDKKEDWTSAEKAGFEASMGISVDEWRKTATGFFAERV